MTAVATPARRRTLDPDRVTAATARRFLSSDVKTGPVAASATRSSDAVPVTTWLPSGPPEQGGTCIGASPWCWPDDRMRCYAGRLETGRPALGRLARWRLDTWQALDHADRADLAAAILRHAYRAQVDPHPRAPHAGHPVARPVVRLGGGGDIPTAADGTTWRRALTLALDHLPGLTVWLYSRAYQVEGQADPLGPLADAYTSGNLPNLAPYLSTDPAMLDRTAAALKGRYQALPVAVLAPTADDGRQILADLGRTTRPTLCPVDRPRRPLPLAVRRPSDQHHRGACHVCGACWSTPTALPDVLFPAR